MRAGLVKKPWQWPWSSAIVHTSENDNAFIEMGGLSGIIDMPRLSWKKYIESPEEESLLQLIKKHTLSGRPLAAASFIEKLEIKLAGGHALGGE